MNYLKTPLFRSEKHRRNVSSLDCVICGAGAPTQCAHANFGKGMALKASDAMCFAACPRCHSQHDQGGLDRDTRRKLEVDYVDLTRAELISRSLWPAEVEQAYRLAYEPMKRAAG